MNPMKLAIERARKTMNKEKGGPFGAAIIDKNGKVIAITSNVVLGKKDPTAHAEMEAIRKASKKLKTYDLSECTLFATGYPCPMCLSAIIWANIKKGYYATDLEDAEKIGFRDNFIYDYLKNKNILVSAPAGSGKTITMIAKVKYLIEKNAKIICMK